MQLKSKHKVLNNHLVEVRQERLELDKKTFQIIQDFTTVQQAIVPAENQVIIHTCVLMMTGSIRLQVTTRALTQRIDRLEKLIEMHEKSAFPVGRGDA